MKTVRRAGWSIFVGLLSVMLVGSFRPTICCGEDWPMWRKDAARSATSGESLPDQLHLRWVVELPKLKPAFREKRLQFDAGYEPIVVGKSMFVASSHSDRVIALDTETGREQWSFYAEGPIRCAPAAWRDRLFVGSDDGCIYCLRASDGTQLWKRRAVPSHRKVLGNDRMISLWPVRGGPVVEKGKVYFAAGVWSFEGVFVFCLDAASGETIWRNDEASFRYGVHPHAAEALGGVTPQGYLVVAGDELVVPCGQAMPAKFDLKTGKLNSFELPRAGRRPGGWFASAAVRRGEVKLDAEVNRDLHEDKVYQGPGSPGVRTTIHVGGKDLNFADGLPGVDAEIHTMLAADGKLFVSDIKGRVYCFGEKAKKVTRRASSGSSDTQEQKSDPASQDLVARLLKQTKTRDGYVLVRADRHSTQSEPNQDLADLQGVLIPLLQKTNFHLVMTTPDKLKLARLKNIHRDSRDRVCLLNEEEAPLILPPYFVTLLLSNSISPPEMSELQLLRPMGGLARFPLSDSAHQQLVKRLDAMPEPGFTATRIGGLTWIRRGPLVGAANYTGGWSSPDERVRAPLGVLWFGDNVAHFKRSPQPWFVDGVMISYGKDWMARHRTNKKTPYTLLPPVFSDVYSGRVLSAEESIVKSLDYSKPDAAAVQPSQYRPPSQLDAWKPKQPIVGERINPLTGEKEPRAIPKSYGCDGGVDYGLFYTMRSGTASFYDKRLESGVCHIAGPRSGCTNSIIPACGVLNVPYFYEGCTCSYPLPVGLAMVSMPARHEQWASWGEGKTENMKRVGINLGAPGDRMTPAGTLWLDSPNRGGPSPKVALSIEPKTAKYFYRHSMFITGGDGWPWVAASGLQGADAITIEGFQPSHYTVRLYFALPDRDDEMNDGVFDVALNGRRVIERLELSAKRGLMKSTVQQFQNVKIDGSLRIELKKHSGQTTICGIEVVRSGSKLDSLVSTLE